MGLTLLGVVFTGGCAPAPTPAAASTYYVCNDASCPDASNANSGKQEKRPWRTIGRVNEQALRPGDVVLLKGGDTFRERELLPSSSGSQGRPIVFSSYGHGHAILTRGIWIPPHRSWLTLEHLTVDGHEQGGAVYGGMDGVAGSAKGHDAHIAVLHDTFEHLGIAINGEAPEEAFTSDNYWLIADDTIRDTGDSGIYVQGDAFTIEHNTIEDTGRDEDRHVNEHGIYLRATNSNVLFNTITRFADDGVSVRYRNSRVEGNTISYGQEGIAWFQYDSIAGTSRWSGNRISHVSGAGIYVSTANQGGRTKESFVITGNTLAQVGVSMTLEPTSGTYTVRGNTPQ